MASVAGSAYKAHDPDRVETEDHVPVDRPLTTAEVEYLDARVEETAAAIETIKEQIEGAKRSLRAAEQAHKDAVSDRESRTGRSASPKRRTR